MERLASSSPRTGRRHRLTRHRQGHRGHTGGARGPRRAARGGRPGPDRAAPIEARARRGVSTTPSNSRMPDSRRWWWRRRASLTSLGAPPTTWRSPSARIAVVHHPLGGADEAGVLARADGAVEQALALFTDTPRGKKGAKLRRTGRGGRRDVRPRDQGRDDRRRDRRARRSGATSPSTATASSRSARSTVAPIAPIDAEGASSPRVSSTSTPTSTPRSAGTRWRPRRAGTASRRSCSATAA